MKNFIDEKNGCVKCDIIPKRNEEYISVTYGYIRFIDSYRFLSNSLDKLIKTLDNDDFNILEKLS